MLKKIVIFRLGSSEILQADSAVIVKIMKSDKHPLLGVGNPIGFITLILTDVDPTDIARAYAEEAARRDDVLPVLVWDLDTPDPIQDLIVAPFKAYHEMVEIFNKECAQFLETSADEPVARQITLTLDELLDIANERGGVDKLSEAEFKLLQKLGAEEFHN